jgi:frataxin-like iron-binding protein CyaY
LRCIKKVAAACEAAKPDTMGRVRQLDSGATDALFDPFLTDDEVFILDLGPQGQYSLKCDDGRLQLDSALSGSRQYTYHAENDTWCDPADGQRLEDLLARELQEIASVRVTM